MKKISLRTSLKPLIPLSVLIVLAIAAFVPATAFAQQAQPAKCSTADLQCIINAGNVLIEKRLAHLNTLKTKITNDQTIGRLTGAQASELLNDVSTNESGLNGLKSKLDAETVAREAAKDVQNIYTQFRIYAVVLPRDYRHIVLDIEMNAKEKMVNAEPAIQSAISQAPADQQDKLNTLFNDYKQNIANAEAQFTTANEALPQMTPANFNQSRVNYETTRKNLDNATKTARLDLRKAANDLKQIVAIIGHDI